MYPHRIQLLYPWQHEPLPSGAVRFSRRFGYPGRIDAYERVWITVAGLPDGATVSVNKQLLGEAKSLIGFEKDVTGLLQPRNEVAIELTGQNPFLTALEVRRTAYLRGCRVWYDAGRWHAAGELLGDAEGDLELYLIVGRHNVAYRTLRPTGSAVAFELLGEEASEPAPGARLELVQGAVVWYGVDVPAGK